MCIQVRMDALGLVCESHRSTETLSRQEIELIRHFLPFNLNIQSPGVRQQTVSLLKKVENDDRSSFDWPEGIVSMFWLARVCFMLPALV